MLKGFIFFKTGKIPFVIKIYRMETLHRRHSIE